MLDKVKKAIPSLLKERWGAGGRRGAGAERIKWRWLGFVLTVGTISFAFQLMLERSMYKIPPTCRI